MFVVWGTKRVVRKLGFIAEFCPICRDLAEFKVSRIGMAGHVYYLSIGSGKLVGHSAECQTCKSSLYVDPSTYLSIAKHRHSGLERLIDTTYPGIRTDYAERLRLEETIRSRPALLSAEDRNGLLREPFQHFDGLVEERCSRLHMDTQSTIGLFATLILVIVLVSISGEFGQTVAEKDRYAMFVGGVLVAGLVYTLVQLGLGPRRFVCKRVIPLLANALRPLNPTKDELGSCLAAFKKAGRQIGKLIKLDRLWNALEHPGVSRTARL